MFRITIGQRQTTSFTGTQVIDCAKQLKYILRGGAVLSINCWFFADVNFQLLGLCGYVMYVQVIVIHHLWGLLFTRCTAEIIKTKAAVLDHYGTYHQAQ